MTCRIQHIVVLMAKVYYGERIHYRVIRGKRHRCSLGKFMHRLPVYSVPPAKVTSSMFLSLAVKDAGMCAMLLSGRPIKNSVPRTLLAGVS